MTWQVACGNLAADSRRNSTSSWEGLALCMNLGTRQDPSPGWEHRKGSSVPRTREPQRKVPHGEMGVVLSYKQQGGGRRGRQE